MTDLDRLVAQLRDFARERDWDQFHSPKNESRRAQAREEIADVLLYVLRLADGLGIDPLGAAADKIRRNAERYPAEKVRGQARKADEYGSDDSDGPSVI